MCVCGTCILEKQHNLCLFRSLRVLFTIAVWFSCFKLLPKWMSKGIVWLSTCTLPERNTHWRSALREWQEVCVWERERWRRGGIEGWRGSNRITRSKWNHGMRVIVITQHYSIHYEYLVEVWPNGKLIATPLLCLSMSDRTEDVNFLIRLKMRWNCVWPRSGTGRLLNNPHIRWMSLWLLSHREHGCLNGREMEPALLHILSLFSVIFYQFWSLILIYSFQNFTQVI